jgi:hypothetical protein
MEGVRMARGEGGGGEEKKKKKSAPSFDNGVFDHTSSRAVIRIFKILF